MHILRNHAHTAYCFATVCQSVFQQFSFIILQTIAHTDMKFSMRIYYKNDSGGFLGTIKQLLTELCPCDLEKFQLFAFLSLSLQKLNKLISDITKKSVFI